MKIKSYQLCSPDSLISTVMTLFFVWCTTILHIASSNANPFLGENVQLRGSLNNSRLKFTQQKQGHVAFMGGSITEMNGYRPMVCENLRKRFPETKFTFTDAGISSTCSTTGAFRLATDVLSQGPVDLFFVEFAVNDDQDAGHARRECIRGMEGILRHCRRHNPNMDIILTFFVNEGMLKKLQADDTPLTIMAHGDVAKHYQVSTINLAKQVAEQIAADKLTWKQYGGVHPAPVGNAICAKMIEELFDSVWSMPLDSTARISPHPIPAEPLDPHHYGQGHFINPVEAISKNGWKLEVPDWKVLPGSKRPRFSSIPLFCATSVGSEATLEFIGTAVGAFLVAGPDAGKLEASLDGGPNTLIDTFHNYSRGLHYPRTVMFATDLTPGRHLLTLKVSDQTNSDNHAVRIIQFVAN